jgi:probable phosphoglycerate mutase
VPVDWIAENGPVGEIILIRHGQTEWSAASRHTSTTDLPLTAEGERQAQALGQALAGGPDAADSPAGRRFEAVLSSPRQRALRTAELAGLTVTAVDEDLAEWHYGGYEGITTKEIRATRPDWDLWRDGCPGGETPEQIGARIDRVLARARALLPRGDVALVGHGHALRVAGARWAGFPVAAGGRLALDTATISTLGYEHERPVIRSWNAQVT